jgi:hypothetical protein
VDLEAVDDEQISDDSDEGDLISISEIYLAECLAVASMVALAEISEIDIEKISKSQ